MGQSKYSMKKLAAMTIALCLGVVAIPSEKSFARGPLNEAYMKKHKKFVLKSDGKYSAKIGNSPLAPCKKSKLALYDAITAMRVREEKIKRGVGNISKLQREYKTLMLRFQGIMLTYQPRCM